MKKWIPALVTLLVTQQVLAEPGLSPYSFGGSCPSQGTWTQTVLGQTQRLKEVIEGLADDPNCKALSTSMQTQLSNIQGALGTADQQKNYSGVAQLMGQIGTMTSFLKSGNIQPAPLANLVLDSKLNLGEAEAKSGLVPDANKAMGFSSLGQRAAAATDSGLSLFNNLVDGIKSQERCIQSQGGLSGQLLSGSVYLLSAFAASGDSAAGAKISESISRLAEMIKSSKYRQALAKLDMTVYQNSLRCLLEMSADTFCSIKDNFEIVKLGVDSMVNAPAIKSTPVVNPIPSKNWMLQAQPLKTPPVVAKLVSNPFSGMYVLTHHLPNITAFIQKVMLGVEPNNPFEAAKKSEITNTVSNYHQSVDAILGAFNRAALNVASNPSPQAQRSLILQMLETAADSMRDSGKDTNFFRITRPSSQWKLVLLGLPKDVWPPELSSGNSNFDVNRWLDANANNGALVAFNNPQELIATIRQNLLRFIDEANLSATAYYSENYLADKVGILDSLVADQRVTVKESLSATLVYLNELQRRLTSLNGDREILLSIADTKVRIQGSLRALELYNRSNSGNPAELQAAAATVMSQIYSDFNVLSSHSGFLSKRITNYVRYDYRLLIKSGLNMSDYQRSLMLAMGQDLMSQMVMMQNKSAQAIQSDLQNASSLALQNLSIYEDVFFSEFNFQTSLWKMRAEGKKIDNWSVGNESNRRLNEDSRDYFQKVEPGDSDMTKFWKGFSAFFSTKKFVTATINQFDDQRYPNLNWPGRQFTAGGVDDEYKSAEHIFGQMCIQSLAFNKWADFAQMCEKATLKSVFDNVHKDGAQTNLSVSYADAYRAAKLKNSNDKVEKAQKQAGRICAFRNFYRNNYVYQITVGQGK